MDSTVAVHAPVRSLVEGAAWRAVKLKTVIQKRIVVRFMVYSLIQHKARFCITMLVHCILTNGPYSISCTSLVLSGVR